MNRRTAIVLGWSALALLLTSACTTIPRHPRRLRYERLQFDRPRPQRHVLGNGMVVYLLENRELPLISGNLTIRTGRLYDPEDKIGLAALTGTVLRTGGAGDRTAEEIDERLEFLAASVETGMSTQQGTASFRCLSKDLDEVLQILDDVLRRPRFAQDKIDLRKKQMAETVRRQNDSPRRIVSREFGKLVFASSPAWSRTPTLETIERLTRDDLVAFHKRYYHPNNIIAGISGDFDSAALLKRLEELFGDWPRRDVDIPSIPRLAERNQASVNYVHKDIPQSYIQFGHLGMNRHDPARFAADIMNYILGSGGFTSRLMAEIRSNRGLAYSVGAVLSGDTDRGRFSSWCQTKTESTHEAISTMLDIIGRMATDPISDEEMDKAKSSLVNRFVFRFETPQGIVNEQVSLEYYGYPKDYLDTYIEKVEAVTKQDVHDVAKRFIHPDQMIILVVGDKTRLEEPLSKFGKVREIPLKSFK